MVNRITTKALEQIAELALGDKYTKEQSGASNIGKILIEYNGNNVNLVRLTNEGGGCSLVYTVKSKALMFHFLSGVLLSKTAIV